MVNLIESDCVIPGMENKLKIVETLSRKFITLPARPEVCSFFLRGGHLLGNASNGEIIFDEVVPRLGRFSLIEKTPDGAIFRETDIS